MGDSGAEPRVSVFDDAERVARAAAERVVELAAAVRAKGRQSIARSVWVL